MIIPNRFIANSLFVTCDFSGSVAVGAGTSVAIVAVFIDKVDLTIAGA